MARNLFTSGLRFAELQQCNVSFLPAWMGYCANLWRELAERVDYLYIVGTGRLRPGGRGTRSGILRCWRRAGEAGAERPTGDSVVYLAAAEALVMLEASELKERDGWMAEFDPKQVREEGEYDHIERILRTARFIIVDPPFPPTILVDVSPIPVEEFLASFR